MSQGKGAPSDQKKSAPAPAAAKAAAPVDDAGHNAQVLNSVLTSHQKATYGSGFADTSAERRRNSLLAMPAAAPVRASSTELPRLTEKFDGTNVPAALQGRDLWKAVQAPLQSAPGKRSKAEYAQVVLQFGVTNNPRYADDAPGKGRGHIFVWDVSRAMGCEIPHFVGAKELSLVQTCDWLRHEGPMRGWKRLNDYEVIEAANAGYLVVVMPKDRANRHIAIVAPQEDTNRPLLTGVGLTRSNGAQARELFGTQPLECFFHD